MWDAIDGVTYNTGGTYDVVITLHATSDTAATAYMTLNGRSQGFYVPGWHSGPADLMPAGMTFTGDMAQMQVFYGIYGYGATHSVAFEDITVTGCRAMVVINGCDTGVFDQVLADGTTISGNIAACAENARNHGQFVSCVAHLTNDLVSDGYITGKEKGQIQRCAAKADIPAS